MVIFGLSLMRGEAVSIKLVPKIGLLFLLTLGGALEAETATATFAGGCFWCMQEPFDELPGVSRTVVGFSGGRTVNPSYKEVTNGGTGHFEAVQVDYDPAVVSYKRLLDIFWRNIDPLDSSGQFCDRGNSYRTAIFVHNNQQRQAAMSSLQELDRSGRFAEPVVTEIIDYSAFYPAEEYHQKYYRTNASRYKVYRYLCGRDTRLQELWGRS